MEEEMPTNVKRITPQSKASSQRRLIRRYSKNSRSNLGLSKTTLVLFISQTRNICKRDLILVLRKIKFNEPFDVLGANFSMAATTALYIFKRRVKQLANQMAKFIDWYDGTTIYKQYNPLRASENLMSMVDHLVIDRKRKYFISCTAFGLVNFLSKGYPYNMANRKMVEQSNFTNELPRNADVMGPKKYKFLTYVLPYQSCYYMWEAFEQNLIINYYSLASVDRWVKKPMILQVKRKLRRFKILSDSNLDPKLLSILDEVMVICAALCNLRKNWCAIFQQYYENVDHEHGSALDEEVDGEVEEVGEEADLEEYEEIGQVEYEEVGEEECEEVGEEEYEEVFEEEYEGVGGNECEEDGLEECEGVREKEYGEDCEDEGEEEVKQKHEDEDHVKEGVETKEEECNDNNNISINLIML